MCGGIWGEEEDETAALVEEEDGCAGLEDTAGFFPTNVGTTVV